MELQRAQELVDEWIRTKGGGYWNRFQILARLTEEVGELAAALQRVEGLRPRPSQADLEEEVGDVLYTLAAFANVSDIDLGNALEKVIAKYDARDA